MGAFLACMITRDDLLGDAVREESAALTPFMPSEADGYGVGFYQAGEVLHRKRPQVIHEPVSFSAVIEDIKAQVAIAHVREATVGDGRAENTQPFRMRQWLFGHVGSLAGQDQLRERIERELPDFLRRNMRGQTDSELLFHVVLSFLHESGQLDVVDVAHGAVVSALRKATETIDRHAAAVGAVPSSLTLALTNGRQLYAMQRGWPLAYVERTGIPKRDSDRPGEKRPAMLDVRYVAIASCRPDACPEGYTALADNDILCVDRDLRVSRNSAPS
jgi:predicted glutamine amidotransferase